ncbi:MAG: DUF1192 domain-containing protein [Alphaproteobacteria bacterium]|nr:DUF1192 domain-containing protein [Alphaproteobacteria bacterium]
MDEEAQKPRVWKPGQIDLGSLSVAELTDYIAALETEIARVRADIARKERHRSGADSLFKR